MTDARTVQRRVDALLERHGRTFCDELGIRIADGTRDALFCWLVASILYSTRVKSDLATAAAAGLFEAGWTRAETLGSSRFEDRVAVLDAAHYTRYDERMAKLLAEAATHVASEYDGDLNRLREAAERAPKAERAALQAIPGLGPTGSQIFMREAQLAWEELYPFCDKKAWSAAKELELARTVKELAGLVPRRDFPRLVAALARASLAKDVDDVREAA